MAGIADSLLLVSICGLCTFLTGISLSAIATNGAMKVLNIYMRRKTLHRRFYHTRNILTTFNSFKLDCDVLAYTTLNCYLMVY